MATGAYSYEQSGPIHLVLLRRFQLEVQVEMLTYLGGEEDPSGAVGSPSRTFPHIQSRSAVL